jgi:hypothetical protein
VLPLSDTPTTAAGPRQALFGGTLGSWEQEAGSAAAVVENPWIERRRDTYFLFYSGGSYLGSYGMGYATSAAPTGGFAKSSLNPILAQTDDVLSPGGGSVTIGPGGESWLVYHGRSGDHTQPRTLRIDPVYWSGTSVFTPGPTTGQQTFPPEEPPTPPEQEPPLENPPVSDPPPAGPAEVTPPPDLTAPVFGLRAKAVRRPRRMVRLTLGPASEDAWVTVTGRARFARSRRSLRVRAIRARFVAAGNTAELRIGLPRRAVRVVLKVVARDAAGNRMARTLAVRLVR